VSANLVDYDRVKRAVMATEDPTERKIRFVALLTSSLPKDGPKPVVTGGSAVEIYLDGVLRTGDIDIVYNVSKLKAILKAWHFGTGSGLRSFVNEELVLAVDAVGDQLSGSYDKLTTIPTNNGPVIVIGIEDLILKRLASAKFWKVTTDMEQSYLLAKSHESHIDWGYLERRAKEEDISDYLKKLKKSLKNKRVS
jgi:hypothetical protein